MADKFFLLCLSLFLMQQVNCDLLCDSSFCRTYGFETGCGTTSSNCRINNATHSGLWLPSPTICNCCDFCLPFIREGQHCSLGGPGTGTTVGRCGDGLTCTSAADGYSYCERMDSECHSAQDDYDARHELGQVGALEQRPLCDGKGNYAASACIPTQTCFCQNEEGHRIFGETMNLGSATALSMSCGCSLLHEKIKETITAGVTFPVIGPRCTSDGNFNPVQCMGRACHCVNRVTGAVQEGNTVHLDREPITKLPCYDASLDLFPEQSAGDGPYNHTTPCFEEMERKIELYRQSEEEGYIVEFFSEISTECLPDGTYGRITKDANGTKTCVDAWGEQIQNFEARPNSPGYDTMDCKCAQTIQLMTSSTEHPVCCSNGNFRAVQCRRGQCRCVDGDGRQVGREAADVTALECWTQDWRTC